LEAATQVIRYWSVAEQSTRVIPVTGVFLYNRILWPAIGLIFLAMAYVLFDPFKLPKEKKKKIDEQATSLSFKGIDFVWITDGRGWQTTKRPLEETYNHNDCVFNLAMLEAGALDELSW
jgi:hypothetical protein